MATVARSQNWTAFYKDEWNGLKMLPYWMDECDGSLMRLVQAVCRPFECIWDACVLHDHFPSPISSWKVSWTSDGAVMKPCLVTYICKPWRLSCCWQLGNIFQHAERWIEEGCTVCSHVKGCAGHERECWSMGNAAVTLPFAIYDIALLYGVFFFKMEQCFCLVASQPTILDGAQHIQPELHWQNALCFAIHLICSQFFFCSHWWPFCQDCAEHKWLWMS